MPDGHGGMPLPGERGQQWALFLAGTVAGGVAVGAVFLGSLATANRLAPPGRRGQAISTFFVACYAGLIIPVVGVEPPAVVERLDEAEQTFTDEDLC